MAGPSDAEARIQAAQIAADAETTTAAATGRANVEATTIQASYDQITREYIADREYAWHIDGNDKNLAGVQFSTDGNLVGVKYQADAEFQSRVQVATIQTSRQVEVAQIEAGAQVEVAQIQTSNQVRVAQIEAGSRVTVAEFQLDGTRYSADKDNDSAHYTAIQQHDAQIAVATIQTSNQVIVANIESAARRDVASTEASAQVSVATLDQSTRTTVATTELTGVEYRSDKDLAGVNAHELAETNRLNLKINFAQDKFDKVYPLIQQAIDEVGNQGLNPTVLADLGPGEPVAPHASLTTILTPTNLPYIGVVPVLAPSLIQQQVNAAYSRNDARTASQIRQVQGDLAGRGFSSNSPLLDAMRVGFTVANLRASIEAATTIRVQSAQANVDAVFRAQQGRSEQFKEQEQVVLDNERNQITRIVGVLQAVASIVGGAF